jgi:hypothetical protein
LKKARKNFWPLRAALAAPEPREAAKSFFGYLGRGAFFSKK